jgi:AsmA protein
VFANLQDGSIRSINIAQMMRSLTSNTLSGWQQSDELSTDLTQLSACFRVDKGQAVTTDLNLIGPLVKVSGVGTIDLGTKMMGFRVEPKLVLTTEGQGRKRDPVGFGIPVMIEGSWAAPRIYPDMAGVLDHPEAAYAKLREMGRGLFGPDGAALNGILDSLGLGGNAAGSGQSQQSRSGTANGGIGGVIGNLIEQGLHNSRSLPTSPSDTAPQAAPPSSPNDPPPTAQESQPMNDVLRRLFNR